MDLSEIEIVEVSAHYGETKSLPDYSNVKPGYSLKAVVKPGQDPEAVKAALAEQVKAWVWEDCDQALEREGRPAEFSKEPRFDALYVMNERYVAIIPTKSELPHGLWSEVRVPHDGWRKQALIDLYQNGYTIGDFSHGDLSLLPSLVNFQVSHHQGYVVLYPKDLDSRSLPDDWRYVPRKFHTRFVVNYFEWAENYAKEKDAILIDCLDGDLSRLPDLTEKNLSPEDEQMLDVEFGEGYEEGEKFEIIDDRDSDDDDDDDWEDDDEGDFDSEPIFDSEGNLIRD